MDGYDVGHAYKVAIPIKWSWKSRYGLGRFADRADVLAGPKERAMTIATVAAEQAPPRGPLAPMALAALGVVYGDIGTSPLYTFKMAVAWVGAKQRQRPRSACCR